MRYGNLIRHNYLQPYPQYYCPAWSCYPGFHTVCYPVHNSPVGAIGAPGLGVSPAQLALGTVGPPFGGLHLPHIPFISVRSKPMYAY